MCSNTDVLKDNYWSMATAVSTVNKRNLNSPTIVNDPHSASNHIGSLFPLPLEGRIPRFSTGPVEWVAGPSPKEGNDIDVDIGFGIGIDDDDEMYGTGVGLPPSCIRFRRRGRYRPSP